MYFKSKKDLNYDRFVDPNILGAARLVHSDLRIYRISFFLLDVTSLLLQTRVRVQLDELTSHVSRALVVVNVFQSNKEEQKAWRCLMDRPAVTWRIRHREDSACACCFPDDNWARISIMDLESMLVHCKSRVVDSGPTLIQHVMAHVVWLNERVHIVLRGFMHMPISQLREMQCSL